MPLRIVTWYGCNNTGPVKQTSIPLTMNYVLTGDKQGMVNDLNAFFNPMKADVD